MKRVLVERKNQTELTALVNAPAVCGLVLIGIKGM